MVMSPQVSWLFFKAVRAGLAVKPHIWIHTGRASNAEKQPTGRGPEGCVENGPAAVARRLRIESFVVRLSACPAIRWVTSSAPPFSRKFDPAFQV